MTIETQSMHQPTIGGFASQGEAVAAAMRDNQLASRGDAQRLLIDLFNPLVGAFSPGRAQVKLGRDAAHFDRKAAWFEGFARPLWGLAPLHAGGGAFAHWDLYRQGLVSGSDPGHAEYWEMTLDRNQRSVEIAALGFALALAPDALWLPLADAARERLAQWIRHIETVEMADNNWHFFPVMAGLGLERAGVALDEPGRDRHVDRIDAFYNRDGWYGDGPGGFIDHYNGFALHFYGLIYARHAATRDPARAARLRDRASAFAEGFRHWFGRDGGALAIGRSLTYRFAFAGFWGALAYAGVEALPWGQIRTLWARQLRWWMRKPILDAQGRLSVGYTWPNYLMSEEYNSPGSPYWAFKAFLPLALPEEHPFWQAEEMELPEPDRPVLVPGAAMLVQHQQGDVVALPAGPVRLDMRNSSDKYGKFAYSSRFGLTVEADRYVEMGFFGDNILAVSTDGKLYRSRGQRSEARLGESWIETRWSPEAKVSITTLQGFVRSFELRIHRVTTDHPLSTLESGHAVPARCGSRERWRSATPSVGTGPNGIAILLDDGHRSAIAGLERRREAQLRDAAPNTNIVFPHSAVPVLSGHVDAGRDLVLITAVRASFGATDEIWDGLPTLDDAVALCAAAGTPLDLDAAASTLPLDLRTQSLAAIA
ncbi:hypothetical protein SAMN05519103_02170 [Rhizobiales bacterium GAS113]|nr:hypothetical protein SAMN05519103_02170 [Rhizobiales bacterium GAS113]